MYKIWKEHKSIIGASNTGLDFRYVVPFRNDGDLKELVSPEALTKKCKIRPNGVAKGSRDPILEFWDRLIPQERFKPETSNLAQR